MLGRMYFDETIARDVLDSAHVAWSKGDVEAILQCCTDDLVYWSNTGGPWGRPLELEGKAALHDFLTSIVEVAECVSATDYFTFASGTGRAKVECYIRHRQTGLFHSCTFRQLVTFRGSRIAKLEDYHDAAMMTSFWRLIAFENKTQFRQVHSSRCGPFV